MGKHKDKGRYRDIDELRWYEILTCCCKWRAECKSCVTSTCVYFIPIILLIGLAGASITIGVIHREDCSYQESVPYWVIVSSVTPFFLLTCIKGMTEDYYGITLCNVIFLLSYLMFTAGLILGSVWIFKTWMNASDSDCNNFLRHYSFILVLVHWFIFLQATMALIFILTRICCCCAENAIRPLKVKGNINLDGDDLNV